MFSFPSIHYLARTSYYLLVIALMSVYVLSWLTTRPDCNDYSFYVVNSDSMRPTMEQGALIMITCDKNYQAGDIITFRRPTINTSLHSSTITHRIIQISTSDEKISYLTRGDANFAADGWTDYDDVIGGVKISIAHLGKLILWLQTNLGKLFGIYLPVATIVLIELRRLYKPN